MAFGADKWEIPEGDIYPVTVEKGAIDRLLEEKPIPVTFKHVPTEHTPQEVKDQVIYKDEDAPIANLFGSFSNFVVQLLSLMKRK